VSDRTLVIVNPGAGGKSGGAENDVDGEVESVLAAAGIDAEIAATASVEEARARVAEWVRAGCRLVVAAGGDGTIGVVATELLGTSTALGILPGGSIMNIPRMLGLPRDPAAAARILRSGVVRTIDVGEVAGRPFFEAASVGMNAAMFREADRFRSGDRGSLLRTVWAALRYRPARMSIELDNEIVRTRALTVTVSNGPYTGTGMTVAPDARLDDGRFDVVVFERFSKLELVRHLGSIAFGRRNYAPRIRTYRSTFARITSVHPLPCRADSHDLGTTPVEFRVRPAALRVLVPADPPTR
jgi:diacylglycerol kinase (ATP)